MMSSMWQMPQGTMGFGPRGWRGSFRCWTRQFFSMGSDGARSGFGVLTSFDVEGYILSSMSRLAFIDGRWSETCCQWVRDKM